MFAGNRLWHLPAEILTEHYLNRSVNRSVTPAAFAAQVDDVATARMRVVSCFSSTSSHRCPGGCHAPRQRTGHRAARVNDVWVDLMARGGGRGRPKSRHVHGTRIIIPTHGRIDQGLSHGLLYSSRYSAVPYRQYSVTLHPIIIHRQP